MIEKVVLDYLESKLQVGCYMEVPNSNEPTFIVIEKVGSTDEDGIWGATIAVQSYASTLYRAASLNEQVKEAMQDITTLDEVSNCELNSDYNFTDTQSKQYRYQAVFNLIHY
ncbi:MAG: hypothetical protein KBT03_07565 [Bacteroidales bacterium]|nr:hypothetical protein [Candidatus Scybalousia scybalohippi]